jgi:UDP-N-acetylmuramoylalanine--D-glutamate ligase
MASRVDESRLYAFATDQAVVGPARVYAIGQKLYVRERDGAPGVEIASLEGVRSLRGRHNVQNALAALTALRALQDRIDARPGTDRSMVWRPGALQAALASFPGLAHRMEEIGWLGKIVFINDSKATNADSTDKALASWERDIFWILGGKSKEGGIASLESYFPRIAKAYLIGAATEEFAATLQSKVGFERCGTLDAAVAAAARDASKSIGVEPVILLSPACASFDQYKIFEVRGDHFRKLVSQLPGIELGPSSP